MQRCKLTAKTCLKCPEIPRCSNTQGHGKIRKAETQPLYLFNDKMNPQKQNSPVHMVYTVGKFGDDFTESKFTQCPSMIYRHLAYELVLE